jgi:hypothetical protein
LALQDEFRFFKNSYDEGLILPAQGHLSYFRFLSFFRRPCLYFFQANSFVDATFVTADVVLPSAAAFAAKLFAREISSRLPHQALMVIALGHELLDFVGLMTWSKFPTSKSYTSFGGGKVSSRIKLRTFYEANSRSGYFLAFPFSFEDFLVSCDRQSLRLDRQTSRGIYLLL